MLALCLLAALTPAGAQTVTAKGGPPQSAVLMILVAATSDGRDQVCVTYPRVVPHAQVQQDLQRLAASAGWAPAAVAITEAPAPVSDASASLSSHKVSIRQSEQMLTGVQFVADGAVRPETHTLPVAPFVQTFGDYHRLVLSYFMDRPFDFRGLRDYSDPRLQIAFSQQGAVYTYQVQVKDKITGPLTLPERPAARAVAARAAPSYSAPRGPKPWLIALVAVLALTAGGIVYVALARNG